MILEINSAFKDFKYRDSDHTYFYKDRPLMSVTQFLSKVKPKFNKQFWPVYKAYQFSGYHVTYLGNMDRFYAADTYWEDSDGTKHWSNVTVNIYDDHSHLSVTPADVLEQWDAESIVGTTRGSYIHNYLENRENRTLDDPELPSLNNLSTTRQIQYYNSIRTAVSICDSYLEFQYENLIPVGIECIVGNAELGLAGRFDRLYFNKLSNDYEIWDFKTDKKISTKPFGKETFNLFNLPNTDLHKYSLQTSFYKYMIEQAIPVKLGTSRIVHIDIKNTTYNIINCSDHTELIARIKDEINWATYKQP